MALANSFGSGTKGDKPPERERKKAEPKPRRKKSRRAPERAARPERASRRARKHTGEVSARVDRAMEEAKRPAKRRKQPLSVAIAAETDKGSEPLCEAETHELKRCLEDGEGLTQEQIDRVTELLPKQASNGELVVDLAVLSPKRQRKLFEVVCGSVRFRASDSESDFEPAPLPELPEVLQNAHAWANLGKGESAAAEEPEEKYPPRTPQVDLWNTYASRELAEQSRRKTSLEERSVRSERREEQELDHRSPSPPPYQDAVARSPRPHMKGSMLEALSLEDLDNL